MMEVSDGVFTNGNERFRFVGSDPVAGPPTIVWREDRVRVWVAAARGLKAGDACIEARVGRVAGSPGFATRAA